MAAPAKRASKGRPAARALIKDHAEKIDALRVDVDALKRGEFDAPERFFVIQDTELIEIEIQDCLIIGPVEE